MKILELTLRKLIKNKTITVINIAGLTVVFFVSLLIFLFVAHHYSFDKTIKESDSAYRIITRINDGSFWASSFAAFEDALDNCKEVQSKAIFYKNDEQFNVAVAEKRFSIANPIYADNSFFSFFNFKLRSGQTEDINKPNTVFISPTMANYLFGETNAIGQTIRVIRNNNNDSNSTVFTIAGVFEPFSNKSHINCDIILSKNGFYKRTVEHLKKIKVFGAYTYLKLHKGFKPSDLEAKFHALLNPYLANAQGPPIEAFDIDLQAFPDIHFTTDLVRDISPGIRKTHLNILLSVAILLFITVVFNFLIMNIVSANQRKQQSQIKMYLGALKRHIFLSTLWEILVVVILAGFVVIFAIEILNPWLSSSFFNGWTVDVLDPVFWLVAFSMAAIIVLSSSVSATYNSLKKVADGIKQTRKTASLIVFQFAMVIALLCFTFLINQQLSYINTMDLGYNPENVMIIKINGARDAKINVFKQQVKAIPGVLSAGTAQHYPGFRLQDLNFNDGENIFPFKFAMVEQETLETLGVGIKEQFSEDSDFEFFINETFYNKLAASYTHQQIIESDFNRNQNNRGAGSEEFLFAVHGVVKDFHYSSLYSPIGNFVFFIRNPEKYFNRFLLIRFKQQNVEKICKQVVQIAESIYPGMQIEPQFLNEQLNTQYESEKQLLSVANLFSVITIIVTCMGLMAFMLYTIQLRIKEIGIRKVNGAKDAEIIQLLTKEFFICILIGFIVGTPLAYLAIEKWLQSFAYKTSISVWVFIAGGITTLVLAVLTIGWQTFKAARKNPVESLRYE